MELKGSKTEANLWTAFAGESQARNKYTYFASAAKKAGYEQIAAIFEETAGNEKEHAKMWFKELGGIGDTAATLRAAAEGENEEWTSMYPEMAATAREEGFTRIAYLFEAVAAAGGAIRRGAVAAVAGQYVEQRAGDGQQQDQRQPGCRRGGDALLARDDGDGHERPG